MIEKKVKKVPYVREITLEGLSIIKKETIKIPIKELSIAKKVKSQSPKG